MLGLNGMEEECFLENGGSSGVFCFGGFFDVLDVFVVVFVVVF